MFDVGFTELLVLFVIGLLTLGPERLPRVAAQLGRWMGKARRTAHQLRMQLEREMTMNDIMRDKEEREKRKADEAASDSAAEREYPEEEDANDSGHGDASEDDSQPQATSAAADDAAPAANDDNDPAHQRSA